MAEDIMQQQIKDIHNYATVPVRETIIFPGVVAPLFITRPSSIRSIDWASEHGRIIFVVLEKKPYNENVGPEHLYTTGVICKLLQNLRMPDGTIKVLMEGFARGECLCYKPKDSMLVASVTLVDEIKCEDAERTLAVSHVLRDEFEKYVLLDSKIPDDIVASVCDVSGLGVLSDIIASNSRLNVESKQELIEERDEALRAGMLLKMLINQNNILSIAREFDEKVRLEIDRDQHNYFLREQLKVISDELGEEECNSDANELLEAAKKSSMPEDIFKRVENEIRKFAKYAPMSAEASVARNYIETLCELPWNSSTEDNLDIANAEKVLDEDHYGLTEVKERIIEYLAVKKQAGKDMRGQVICFVGPPGVGKTSLGRSIARAMGRKFINISLGGLHDEAEIRGHRRTYVSALPGRIIQKIKNCGSNNPLILMDEIDKLGSDYRGDPSSALLEVLDPEQNKHFTDNFLEVPFDLSNVMFITTANSTSTIPRPLMDRMEIIQLAGYTAEEKLKIAQRHLIPRIIKEHGLSKGIFSFSTTALKDIITTYTMEAGVRSLDREISKIARKITAKILKCSDKEDVEAELSSAITKERVHEILGAPKLHVTKIPKENQVGNVIGLAWTETGGDVLIFEAAVMDGTGTMTSTGHLGDVMKESAEIALAYIKSHAASYGLENFEWSKKNIHLHVPEGAVPKDGPSAGITLALALCSALTGRKVKNKYAMTGEITLVGNVLPIGGLREKILAAKRHGIKELILPEANKIDAEDLNDWIVSGLKLHYVSNVSEVFDLALCAEK